MTSLSGILFQKGGLYMKKTEETNEQIRNRLKYQLDGTKEDEDYAVKILLGFEPLDDWEEIRKKLNENLNNEI